MHPSIEVAQLPARCTHPERARAVLEKLTPQLDAFFAHNGPRPVFAAVRWVGNEYRARARYVVANSGGQHMTIATAGEG